MFSTPSMVPSGASSARASSSLVLSKNPTALRKPVSRPMRAVMVFSSWASPDHWE